MKLNLAFGFLKAICNSVMILYFQALTCSKLSLTWNGDIFYFIFFFFHILTGKDSSCWVQWRWTALL